MKEKEKFQQVKSECYGSLTTYSIYSATVLAIILTHTLSRGIMTLEEFRTIDVCTNKFCGLLLVATLLTEASTTASANQPLFLNIVSHLVRFVLVIALIAVSSSHVDTLEAEK
jgi:hypothetical protein